MGLFGRGTRRDGSQPLRFFGRDLSVAFLGHLAKGGLGWITFLILTRTWHPNELGVFGLAEAIYLITFQLSELGLSTGIKRFVSKGIRSRDDTATASFLKSVFVAKLSMSAVLFAVGWLTAPWIAGAILERPLMTPYLRIGLLAIFGMHLQMFYQAYLGARLEFALNAVFITLSPLFILGGVFVAWWTETLTARTALWIYALVPVSVCALAMVALPHDFLRSTSRISTTLLAVWRFSRWVYATEALGEVRFRVNSILLSRLGEGSIRDVGLYNYGDKLASTLTLFTHTIMTVFVPRVSHLVDLDEIREVLRRSHRWMVLLVPILAVVTLGARPFISLLTPRYVEAVPVFVLLFVSVLCSLAAMPSRAVLYSINRPQVETAIEALALILTLVGGHFLVARYLAVGAALTMLIQRAVSALLMIGWVHVRVYRGRDPSLDASS